MKSLKRNTKEEILLVSEKLFFSFNFESVSMRDIAEKLQISKAALYYHFKSKEEIVTKIMKNFQEKMIIELKKINNLNIDSVAKIKEIIKVYFVFLQKGKGLLFFMKQSGFKELKSMSESRNRIRNNINEAVYPIIKEAFKNRPKLEVKLAVNFFLGILMSLAVDEILCQNDKNKNKNNKLKAFSDQIIIFMGL